MNAPRLAALALVLVTLAGCGTRTATEGLASGTDGTRAPTSTTPDRTQAPSSTSDRTVATVPGELTAEEALRNNPPPPQNVRARVVNGTVEVTWDDPPAVTIAHSYSDRVVAYRVFRRGPGETELKPIGTTSTHRYMDATARKGVVYQYAVNSIREQNVEGPRSQAATVTLS